MKTFTKIEAMELLEPICRKDGDLFFKMNDIIAVVQLAAFAAESRRILTAVKHALPLISDDDESMPELRSPRAWETMEDTTGAVLAEVADRLKEIQVVMSDEFNTQAEAIRNRTEGRIKPEPTGWTF